MFQAYYSTSTQCNDIQRSSCVVLKFKILNNTYLLAFRWLKSYFQIFPLRSNKSRSGIIQTQSLLISNHKIHPNWIHILRFSANLRALLMEPVFIKLMGKLIQSIFAPSQNRADCETTKIRLPHARHSIHTTNQQPPHSAFALITWQWPQSARWKCDQTALAIMIHSSFDKGPCASHVPHPPFC